MAGGLANPYLAAFDRLHREHGDSEDGRGELWSLRREMVRLYSWAVPTGKVIRVMADGGPIVEIGAGSGYWARLIEDAGGSVHGYDTAGPACGRFFPVRQGGATKAGEYGEDWALFLCWPPLSSPMALDALLQFKGGRVFYVGEEKGGCTGDDAFHDEIERNWEVEHREQLPQWEGMHDRWVSYIRKRRR